MHADDGFDRALQSSRDALFPLPVALHGRRARRRYRDLGPARLPLSAVAADGRRSPPAADARHRSSFSRTTCPRRSASSRSADLHVHMNYGGHYRNTPENLARQARAEDLDVVYNLIVNKEERVPDIAYFRPDPDPASGDGVLDPAQPGISHQLLGPSRPARPVRSLSDARLRRPIRTARSPAPIPTMARSPTSPTPRARWSATSIRSTPIPIRPKTSRSRNELPADVANGKVDYIEIVGFSDHKSTAARLVPPAQPRLPPAGRRGHRRDGQLRLAARARSA